MSETLNGHCLNVNFLRNIAIRSDIENQNLNFKIDLEEDKKFLTLFFHAVQGASFIIGDFKFEFTNQKSYYKTDPKGIWKLSRFIQIL
ncbi:hypothetical protein SSABA_v1c08700 [Spiroplasma sabaudiense Ar-1343]|uniref:Uncharacterized protein n=1 Tax=Spiroplasma sabaudiense Ar-1343 TaxID=1276257 RepID=W6AKM3_9MOLU|nr:hypothetical protein [Spiroplasma sabaudiense]AHI54269.1 hypothetical protein SSABA_v1c08700 [Spiroplasma sabaudiense Ar-1343]